MSKVMHKEHTKYGLEDGIVIRDEDQKVLVLATGNIIELNESAMFVLNILKEEKSLNDIFIAIEDNWELEEGTSLKDIRSWLQSFINEASNEGLIYCTTD